MKKKTLLYLKMIAFVVILVILDQISKFVATANLMGKSKYIVIKGLLSFNYLEGGNKGAAWGNFFRQNSYVCNYNNNCNCNYKHFYTKHYRNNVQ